MVVRSRSLESGASSQGSRTIDSPRKKRELSRTRDRHLCTTEHVSPSSRSSGSKNQNGTLPSTRPPQSPHSKVNHSVDVSSNSKGNSHSPLVQGISLQKARSCPSPQKGVSQKLASNGKPPVAPSIPKVPSSSSSIVSRTLSLTKSALSRTSSVLSKSSKYSTTSHSTIVSLDQRQDSSLHNRQTFYVRVCLGYLAGIKINATSKAGNKSNNLVVAYAALAKSGKRIALSQPLGPNSLGKGSSKQQKLYWTNPKGRGDKSSRSSKRKLLFSLKLEREQDRQSNTADDDSLNSDADYSPEIVKIVLGLKCGDEKYPLGIVNLVINGTETFGQKIDLAIRPCDDIVHVGSKPKRGYFGKKRQVIKFQDHNQEYCLASNATLRVRVDVTPGEPGARKAQIWGDGDDGSYITNCTLDTRGTGCSPNLLQASQGDSAIPPNLYLSSDKERRANTGVSSEQHNDLRDDEEATGEKFPVKYVIAHRDHVDDNSFSSSITSPASDMISWICVPFCGDSIYDQKGKIEQSYSFEAELPSWNATVDSRAGETIHARSLSSRSACEENSNNSARRLKNTNVKEEKRARQRRTDKEKGGNHSLKSGNSDMMDMTDDAYEDLRGAQATLRWYAKKVGVDVEDLLEDANYVQAGARHS